MAYRGRYILTNPKKYVGDPDKITYRSSWERLFMIWADHNDSVVRFNSEGVVIGYVSEYDHKPHRYYVDFWVQVLLHNGQYKEFLVEVKPENQTKPPKKNPKNPNQYANAMKTWMTNCSKWKAAKAFCEAHNMEFLLVTEKTLKIGRYKPKRVKTQHV